MLRPFHRPSDVEALDPLIDDSVRRLVRAPEAPRRLDLHSDSGFRAPHGRYPPRL